MRFVTVYVVASLIAIAVLAADLVAAHRRVAALAQQRVVAAPVAVSPAPYDPVSPATTRRREADQRRIEEASDDLVYSVHRSMGESPEQSNKAVLEARRRPALKPQR